ncbi:MAG: hypothetical protein QOE70_2200 [Chthoniobacter sp.]|jgi:TolA-binding protein|nr:hypothetical protein [Chthoniobacter sp.]
MNARHLVVWTLALAGFASEPLLAQKAGTPAPETKPFRFDPGKPVERAVPVERPIPRATAVEKAPATPTPGPRLSPPTAPPAPVAPRSAVAPASKPAAPPPTPAPPEPDDPGTIRMAPSTTTRSPDQVQLEIADSYYAKKIFDQAAPEYERYLGLYPNAPERATALFRLGESYRRNGSLNGAKNAYEMLLGTYANGDFIGPAAYRLAELYYQEKQYREALPLYRKSSVRLKDPAVANSAKFYTGRCLEALGQKMDARITYEELAASADNNPFQDASRLSLALLLKDAGRSADALKQIQALAKDTQNPELKVEAMVRSGLWMAELDQGAKAEKQLAEAAELAANSKWKEVARMGLLRAQFNSGKYDQVISSYNEIGSQFSAESRPELLLLAADAYRQLNKPAEARALYEQLIRDFPLTTYAKDAQFGRLKLLYAADDPALVPEIDLYLAGNPSAAERDQVMLMKAESLYKKQDYRNAIPLYSALELSHALTGTYKAEALFKLGFCYMQLRDVERGVKTFTSFIDQFPTNKSLPYALIQRALGYQQMKNLTAALKDYDQIITKFPKAKERELALQQKGLILGQQGDNAGMSEAFKTLLQDFPDTAAKPQANYWIGWAAYEAKKYKEAIEPLRKARELDKEQFFEKATFRILLAVFNLEDKAEVAREVGIYAASGKEKVPAQILRWLGTELYKENAFEPAGKYFEMLTPREEAVPDDFLFLGRSRLKLGNFKDAGEALEAYLKLVKEPVPRAVGLLDLAQACIGVKAFDTAQKAADEALTLQPEGSINGEGLIAAGDIQMARGRFDAAARIYRSVGSVLDDDQVTPRALEKSVEAYKKAGNEAEAVKTLNQLQSRYPEYSQQRNRLPSAQVGAPSSPGPVKLSEAK